MTEFSELVKSKRLKLNLSQSRFAEKLGVAWITVWRWEHGANEPKTDAIDFWIKKVKSLSDKK